MTKITKLYRIWEDFGNGDMSLRLETENREYAEGIFPTKKDVIDELRQEHRNGAYLRPEDSFTYHLEETQIGDDGEEHGFSNYIKEVSATWEEAMNYDEDEDEDEEAE